MEETKRELVDQWLSEIWEARNMAALETLLSPSLGDEDEFVQCLALRKDIPLLVEVMHKLVGPLKSRIKVFLEDGDWVSVFIETSAPGSDGATPVTVDSLLLIRFEEGKIAELVSKSDLFCLFEQLGQVPPDAMLGCFSGQVLTWK